MEEGGGESRSNAAREKEIAFSSSPGRAICIPLPQDKTLQNPFFLILFLMSLLCLHVGFKVFLRELFLRLQAEKGNWRLSKKA